MEIKLLQNPLSNTAKVRVKLQRNYSGNNPVKIIFAFQQNTILKHKYQRHILFKRYSHIILMEEEMGEELHPR